MAAKAKEQMAMGNPFSGGGRKVGPKIIREIRLAPAMGGGQTVTHDHMNYDHGPEIHQFSKDEGKKFMAHIMKHTGMEMGDEKGEKKEKGEKGEKAEMKEDAEQEGED